MVQTVPETSQTKHECKASGISSSPAADCKFRAEFLPFDPGTHARVRVDSPCPTDSLYAFLLHL